MGERTIDVRGTAVPWEVDERGTFRATLDGTGYQADTLDGLRNKLVAATRRAAVQVSVPFVVVEKPSFRGAKSLGRGVATGRHQGSRKILVRWASGNATQEDLYGNQLRDLSSEEFEEGSRLLDALSKAEAAWSRFESTHGLDVGRRVDEAIAEAIGEPVGRRL
jgi:hypothetical protein